MKEGRNKERKSILVTILVSIIIFLLIILGYGVYAGFQVRAQVANLNNEIVKLTIEKENLNSDLKSLQQDYNLLYEDIQKIYKSCLNEGPCKGHFPGMSWYCNVYGDEVNDPSHICVCDSSCKMNATEL